MTSPQQTADRTRVSDNRATTLGLTSATEETPLTELTVQGELPSWLTGTLLRNGPARWEFDDVKLNHWFDGMAMLHSFDFGGGRVRYMNRFVQSKAYRSLSEKGELGFSEFATDPCRSRFKRIATMFSPSISDNPNVNILKLGDKFIAMTETAMPLEVDRSTLDVVGVAYDVPGGQMALAHPHADRANGDMINLACKLGATSSQSFFRLKTGETTPSVIAKLKRSRPTYQHSFGMTENWIVFTEFPFAVNPIDILRTGRPFIENFKFDPNEPVRITLIHRETGEIGGKWLGKPGGFCFHHVNAYETDDEVVVDLCRFDDAQIVENLYLDNIRNGTVQSWPYLHRYRLAKGETQASEERLSEEMIELPRINYRANNQRPYRYVYGTGSITGSAFDKIVKIDVSDGSSLGWSEEACGVGEPVFVASPDATAEDDGVVLSIVLDGELGRSFLLVLDASDLSELARAEVSHHIPAGFHGNYVAN
jgi:carotenoid cleavage dioxygenase-like enzyme